MKTKPLTSLFVFTFLFFFIASLAAFIESSEGWGKDYLNKEIEKWKPLAEQGKAEAQNELGELYRVIGNYTEAAEWHKRAAEQGNSEGQYILCWLYRQGHGVVEDFSKAEMWCRRAAVQGHVYAQYQLGWLHRQGYKMIQDYVESAKWYRRAAEQGYGYAQSSLGEMHEKGHGVAKNFIKAHMWFNLSVANGDEGGSEKRDAVEDKMTSEQIAKAQKLAREWMEKYK
jgi:uncharacterized protein